MPELQFVQSGWSETVGAVPASSAGTAVSPSSSPNTKGAFTELVAATTRDSNWALIQITNTGSAVTHYVVDIGIGAATERVIIPDLYVYSKHLNSSIHVPFLFPIFIPAGSRLTARCAASSASSSSVEVSITLFSGTLLAGGASPEVVVYDGAVGTTIARNIDPGGTANTDSSWTELTSATTRTHNWLAVSMKIGDTNMAANTGFLLDIGIGAATEQTIISDLHFFCDTTLDGNYMAFCFPYRVPSGSRLTVRVRSSSSTDGDRDIYVRLYGC